MRSILRCDSRVQLTNICKSLELKSAINDSFPDLYMINCHQNIIVNMNRNKITLYFWIKVRLLVLSLGLASKKEKAKSQLNYPKNADKNED